MTLLGLDVGITGCKAVVFTPSGDILAQAYREYRLYQPQPGWMELDPDEVWTAVQAVLTEATTRAASAPGGGRPVAMSISTHGESVLPVDDRDRPLTRFITAIDTRAEAEALWWGERVGKEAIFRTTGMPLHPMYTANKLMWLRQHDPTTFHQARRFLCMQDFVWVRLGLPAVMDYSLAARTMVFDVNRLAWSDELLTLAGLDPDRLSRVVPAGSIIGDIPDAAEFGLAPNAVAVAGGHDQPCGALGCGAISAGIAMDSTGTVECVAVASPRLVLDDALMASNLPIAPHVAPGMYLTLGWTATGGALLRWYRDTFGRSEMQEAAATGQDVYDLILDQASSGPSPVLVLPHFVGSGTPALDPASKGAIVGLDLSTTAGQIIKAILDSVSYETKLSLDAMERAGIAVSELRAFGGGAKSSLWLQTKADVYGKPVRVMDAAQAPCLGAAILAGAATGVYTSVADGVARTVRGGRVYEPDPAQHARYMEKAALFAGLYPSLTPLNHRLSSAA